MSSLTARAKDPLPLASLSVGSEGVVSAVQPSGALRRRLMELGFVPGTRVRVVRLAPLGDPMEIALRNVSISIRRREAETILVERVAS